MTRKKGGGRESGRREKRAEGTEGPSESVKHPQQTGAVAGPLPESAADPAAPYIRHDPEPDSKDINERIRELEAELDKEKHRFYNDRLNEAIARAERAEASVKDLEARLRDEHDDIPDQVELRGEDRG